MNEDKDLNERLTAYLDALEASAEAGGDFVAEQTPLVVQEYLSWVMWSEACLCLFSLLFIASTSLLIIKSWKLSEGMDSLDRDAIRSAVSIVGGVGILAAVPFVFGGFFGAMKVVVAPRVVIVEKAAELSQGLRP